MDPEERHRRFDARSAEIIVAGAVILEALAHHLSLHAVTAVDRGLRHGVLVDLVRRRFRDVDDSSLIDAAWTMGRRFFFDEAHAMQVARLAMAMFDQLAGLHRLPMAVRPYLEVASVLHDIGHSVSYQRHHRHTRNDYSPSSSSAPNGHDVHLSLVKGEGRGQATLVGYSSTRALKAESTRRPAASAANSLGFLPRARASIVSAACMKSPAPVIRAISSCAPCAKSSKAW